MLEAGSASHMDSKIRIIMHPFFALRSFEWIAIGEGFETMSSCRFELKCL